MSENSAFRGEDESAGSASPALDLAAAAFLCALGLLFAGLSLALPVPDALLSAPGLLPFLTSASMAVMAILLGLSAWQRRNGDTYPAFHWSSETARRLAASVAICIYLASLQVLDAEGFIEVFGTQVPLGSFEPSTIILLAALLRLFWTQKLAAVVAVSTVWTLCLSIAFRGLFGIPLPG